MSATRTSPRETGGLDELGSAMRGELLLPASVGYDTGRRIWNGAIDRRPAGIARCAGVATWSRPFATRASAICSSRCAPVATGLAGMRSATADS